jgi:hypothetical protein
MNLKGELERRVDVLQFVVFSVLLSMIARQLA